MDQGSQLGVFGWNKNCEVSALCRILAIRDELKSTSGHHNEAYENEEVLKLTSTVEYFQSLLQKLSQQVENRLSTLEAVSYELKPFCVSFK